MPPRLHWILALVLALGPASLRLVHGAAAHAVSSTTACAHDEAGHDHDNRHSEPAPQHHCGVCDELASLNPVLPTPAAAPAFVLRCVSVRTHARVHAPPTISAPGICRGQPPPRS